MSIAVSQFPVRSIHAGTAPASTVPANNDQVRTRLRLTARGRRVLIALIAVPIIIGAFFAIMNGGGAGASDSRVADTSTYVTVHAGESLWQIAERIAPQADPRDVVDALTSYNHIDGAVQAGERIAIPSQYVH